MAFGTTPESFAYEIIFTFAALIACVILFGFTALIQRLLGIRFSLFSLLFTTLVILGVIVGVSLYLDQVGEVATGTVSEKNESVTFRREGDWRHHYRVRVDYQLADGSAPAATFQTTPALFDQLHEGMTLQVRSVSINGWFNLARLADQSTLTWLPWRWIAIGLGVLGLVGLIWLTIRTPVGWVLIGLTVLAVVVTPFVLKYRDWMASNDPSRTPLQATGTVVEVRRVTVIDPIPGERSSGDGWESEVETDQPYDIVVVRYQSPELGDSVLGVDAVDAERTAVAPDSQVTFAYSATDPRLIQLPAATRTHHWRNPVGWLREQAIGLALIVGLMGLVIGAERWWGRRRARG